MKKKFLLPVMAMVVAIGMSFATERSTADPQYDWIGTANGPLRIAEVVNCGDPEESCMGQFEGESTEYQIFDGPGLTNPKLGAGDAIRIEVK